MGMGDGFFSLGLSVLSLWPLGNKMGKQMKRAWYMEAGGKITTITKFNRDRPLCLIAYEICT